MMTQKFTLTQTVAHSSANWAKCRMLIQTNALRLSQPPTK